MHRVAIAFFAAALLIGPGADAKCLPQNNLKIAVEVKRCMPTTVRVRADLFTPIRYKEVTGTLLTVRTLRVSLLPVEGAVDPDDPVWLRQRFKVGEDSTVIVLDRSENVCPSRRTAGHETVIVPDAPCCDEHPAYGLCDLRRKYLPVSLATN